jgi:hypothetical protein
MEPKTLAPAKINPAKLLGSSSFTSKKINVSKLIDDNVFVPKSDLIFIKGQVIEIKNLIKSSTLLKQAELEKKRKQKEKDKFSTKESELERKKDQPGTEKIKVPGLPKLGFLDRIKNIIFSVLLGRFIVKMLPNLPKLIGVVKAVSTGVEFAADFSIGLIDALGAFLKKTDEASDKTRGFVKTIGGVDLLKKFDEFGGFMEKIIDATIIAAIAFGELRSSGAEDMSKPGQGAKPKPGKGGRPKVTTSGGGGQRRPDIRNPFRQRPTITTGGGGLPKGGAIKGGLAALIFLIPDLIDSGMLASQGRGKDGLRTFLSAISGVGAGMLAASAVTAGAAALGITGVGIPAAIALAVAGFAASSLAGESAYNLTNAGLKKMGLVDTDPETGKPYQYAGGGSTRGGKFIGGAPKRGVAKIKKREIVAQPTELKPGVSIGGQKNIEKVFPTPKSKDKGKQIDSLGYIKKSNEKISKSPFFGALLSLRDKTLVGQRPTPLDYKIAAQGLNAWMSMTFNSGVGAFASGGQVNADMFLRGEDLTQVIAKSLQDNISKQLDESIQDLMKQMMLKPVESEKKESAPSTTSDVGGQYSPEGLQGEIYQYLLSKGLDDNKALGIMANISRESGFRPGVSEEGGPGVGLFQYSSAGRKDAFLKAVPDYKTNWKGQIDYALREDYAPQYLQRNFSSPQEAADVWMRKWERPAKYIQDTEGPKIHAQYLASLEKYRTKTGYNIPTGVALGTGAGNLSAAQQLASSMGVPLYSHVRNKPNDNRNSYHFDGRAMDFSNDGVGNGTPQQLSLAKELIKRYGATAKEIFYTPLGFSIKDGKKVPPVAASSHYNHVHVAFFGGGPTGKGGIVRTHPGEYIIDKDSVDAFGIDFFDIINQTESVSQRKNSAKQLMSILQFYAGYEAGGRQKIKVKIPAPQVSYVPVPVPVGGGMMVAGGSSTDSDYDSTYA